MARQKYNKKYLFKKILPFLFIPVIIVAGVAYVVAIGKIIPGPADETIATLAAVGGSLTSFLAGVKNLTD